MTTVSWPGSLRMWTAIAATLGCEITTRGARTSPPHVELRLAPAVQQHFALPLHLHYTHPPTPALYTPPAMSNPQTAPDGASLTAMSSPPPQKLDPTYYTWSSTFSILLGRMTGRRDIPLEQNYFSEMDALKADSMCARCEANRAYLLQYSPIVTFLQDEVRKLGGHLHDGNMLCRMCTHEQSGGFSLDHGILLCANKFRNRGHQEDTMAHEMVHAWDHLKFKVENDNLRHQACLEIRASTLSGECRFTREFFTKNQWRITEQLQHCVRRRATLSMMARPGVKDEKMAGDIVNQVWEACFRDTRPFDEIYR
ncbi:peptidase M76 family-domain-containing protein [Ampelomyces quisqualis]|uniref:Mitochondrial inner membrane protease ATP23 n=1 Tax=Ampelomyces quisqualis TaxID=50730 RepID=A0A6A5QCL3_AMPQU|nr:peptidase M76 family-domain-containing protein [Ampelomyces quisqualis]